MKVAQHADAPTDWNHPKRGKTAWGLWFLFLVALALAFAAGLAFPHSARGNVTAQPVASATIESTASLAATLPPNVMGKSARYGGSLVASAGYVVRWKPGIYSSNKRNTIARQQFDGRMIVWLWPSLGAKPKIRAWRYGTATWYSIGDNTPRGSRATSSGRPLGWNGGWTCASVHFPLGTKLLVKGPNGREHEIIVTDRGGLATIDLFKPASDWFGMDGMSSFRYVVLRVGW